MSGGSVWRYRASRRLGRAVTHAAAIATFGRMPPFVSASAAIVIDGSLLVVHDPIRNEPVLPGGHLRWRETPRDAVIREVREESGLLIDPGEIVAVVAGDEWTGEPGIVRVIFAASVLGGELSTSAEGVPGWIDLHSFALSSSRDAVIARMWMENRAERDNETL